MKLQEIGYQALIKKFQIESLPHWHYSSVAIENHTHERVENGSFTHEIYPKKYAIEDNVMNHLEFALKYDGVNLTLLSLIFQKFDEQELIDYINSKPTGKYARRLWYFYEFLTDKTLPLNDLTQGNYVDLLESEKYYVVESPFSIKRQRIRDNLLGDKQFCPIVRKTEILKKYEALSLDEKSKEILTRYPTNILKRALSYLYTKETKSSFKIERVKPSSSRIEKFVALLKEAHRDDFCSKDELIKLQNRIVDARFADKDYRTTQNYVGEHISYEEEKIHYISPKPEDLNDLMAGLINTHYKMSNSPSLAVVHAATIAYGFVYLHPFEDGNGRIHRFLLHNILAREGFTPKGIIFPLSAILLKNPLDYDESLESFSLPLLSLIDYDLNEEGEMLVLNDTSLFYKTMDMTQQVEALYEFIQKTVNEELVQELNFIAQYDASKKVLQKIVDMPNRQIDLFIRFTAQNNGKLSEKKRKKYFEFLTEIEIREMEKALLDI